MERDPAAAFVLLLAACASSANPGSVKDDAVETTERFYRWAVAAGVQPDPAPMRDLLSQELSGLLLARAAHERACAAVAPPDEKPHMLDQSPFFLWPEGASGFSVVGAEREGDAMRVGVRLSYADMEWMDVAVLVREHGRWVVRDLQWERGSLRERMADFLSVSCGPAE